jgi:hypothetical protein
VIESEKYEKSTGWSQKVMIFTIMGAFLVVIVASFLVTVCIYVKKEKSRM